MHPIEDPLGAPWERFHVESRNQAAFKAAVNQHLVNFSPEIQALAAEAPLRLDAPRSALPQSPCALRMALGDVLDRRRSTRAFGETPLTLADLAVLLRSANAVRAPAPGGRPSRMLHRAAPTAGGLGSVEIFVVARRVEGLDPGVHHFDTVTHDLAALRLEDPTAWLSTQAFYQPEFAEAGAVLVLTAAIGRLTAKYGARGYRLALLDAGHASQNLQLAATALGLSVCASAGFIDDAVDRMIGLDGLDTASLLAVVVGSAPLEAQAD